MSTLVLHQLRQLRLWTLRDLTSGRADVPALVLSDFHDPLQLARRGWAMVSLDLHAWNG